METGIMIMGAAGAGKTSLGKLVAEKLGFKFIDIDEYIWRNDTEKPFTIMYSKGEKIRRLMDAISEAESFVMAGSMYSIHEYFDPYFELVVYLQTDTETRLERVQERELRMFGNRILEGGDMYGDHQKFLKDVAGYENGTGASTLQQHEEWMDALKCKILRLDGGRGLEENVEIIVKEYLKESK